MKNSEKALKTPIRIALATLLVGVLMRVLQIPYASVVTFVSFLTIGVLYSVRFSKKQNKQPISYIKMVLVLFWTTNGILRILDFPYTFIFQIGTAILFIAWFAMEGTSYFMDDDRKAKNSIVEIIWNIAMVGGVLTIIAGGLMHLLDWNYAIPTLTVGLSIVTMYILKDIFSPSKEINKDGNNEEYQL